MTEVNKTQTTHSVFESTETKQEDVTSGSETPLSTGGAQDKPTFKSLVGEGKKFKDEELLAKGKLESDRFIEQLQSELKGLRAALSEKESEEKRAREFANRLHSDLDEDKKEEVPQGKQISAEDLKTTVKEALSQVQLERELEANIKKANDFLIEHFGGLKESQQFIQQKSEELGVPVSWMIDVAAKNPKALYNLLGVNVDETKQREVKSIVESDVNLVAKEKFQPVGNNVKTYYDELRKKDPTKYWSPEVQQEIFSLTKQGKYK